MMILDNSAFFKPTDDEEPYTWIMPPGQHPSIERAVDEGQRWLVTDGSYCFHTGQKMIIGNGIYSVVHVLHGEDSGEIFEPGLEIVSFDRIGDAYDE